MPDEAAVEVVIGCLLEVEGMSKREKHEYLFQKLRHSAEGVSEGGYLECDYKLGTGTHRQAYGVCHTCFQNVYEIGHTLLYDLRTQVKHNVTTTEKSDRDSDASGSLSKKNNALFVKQLLKFAEVKGYGLDRYEMESLAVPNNSRSLVCFTWLADHFDLVAESEPNSGHMTIEPITLEEIYDEYAWDMGLSRETCVSSTTFRRIWRGCFPQVRRRPYIECNLKCMTCAALGAARKTHRSKFCVA